MRRASQRNRIPQQHQIWFASVGIDIEPRPGEATFPLGWSEEIATTLEKNIYSTVWNGHHLIKFEKYIQWNHTTVWWVVSAHDKKPPNAYAMSEYVWKQTWCILIKHVHSTQHSGKIFEIWTRQVNNARPLTKTVTHNGVEAAVSLNDNTQN